MTDNIYETVYLQRLFDEMQGTYERVSTICSFGFNRRWRRQLVQEMALTNNLNIADIMAGSGESWLYLLPHARQLIAVDFSAQMIAQAKKRQTTLGAAVMVLEENALQTSIPNESIDSVVCIYGCKTLNPDDQERLVVEMQRILKPGGVFGMVEVSVPPSPILRLPYLLYLRWIVPLVGKLFLGNPQNYRMLSEYTVKFGDCAGLANLFGRHGIETRQIRFFWGCATALVGRKSIDRQ